MAFEAGAIFEGGKVELYLPWSGFVNKRRQPYVVSSNPPEGAQSLAALSKENWEDARDTTKSLLARNAQILLGKDMIDRYASFESKKTWSEKSKYETWQKIWYEHAKHNQEFKPFILDAISEDDIRDTHELEKKHKHDVVAFLSFLENKYKEKVRLFHLGLTSSDIVDTALALNIKKSEKLIYDRSNSLLTSLKHAAVNYRHVHIIGRTHGMHADVTTLGLIFLQWYADISRVVNEIRHLSNSITGKLSGPVGNYLTTSIETERKVLIALGLNKPEMNNQVVQRDTHAMFFCSLACLCSTIEKIAVSIRNWHRQEIGEVKEGFSEGQRGSSAMPHKKNPIACENLSGIARLVRSYASASLENIVLWNERDISNSSVERIIAPDACALTEYAVVKLNEIVKSLVVDERNTKQNIKLTKGTYHSSRVLTALIRDGMSRDKAYTLVQEAAFETEKSNKTFLEILKDKGVSLDKKTTNVILELEETTSNLFNEFLL